MGSLIGHIVPGTFFGLFAMWWTFDFLRVYFRSEENLTAGRAGKAKNSEHFTRISSLILFVFTCKGVHMMA